VKRLALLILTICVLLPAPASAQRPEKKTAWSGQVGAGLSGSIGIIDELMEGGFSITGGATYNVRRAPFFGFWFEGNYNGWDVKQQELETLGVKNGDLRIWSITSGISLRTRGKVGFYGALGGGWYRQQIDLVNPAESNPAIACNSWWNYCTGVSLVVSQNVVGQVSDGSVGYNAGLGLTFKLRSENMIYIEVKYHNIPHDVAAIELIPFIVGYRW